MMKNMRSYHIKKDLKIVKRELHNAIDNTKLTCYYEREVKDMEERKMCMFNTESSNVAGYCKLHDCSMTVKQIKCKQCLQKQCWHLERNEEHKWWKQRAEKKEMRKARKAKYA